MIYLDNAATSLIKPQAVLREMQRAVVNAASPGRGGHGPAMFAADAVYNCRLAAAELFNVPEPERVVFTANATHALNIALNSLAKKDSKVLISSYEHNSVTRPLAAMGAEIMLAESPLFDRNATLKAFEEKINEAELVVCTHVSNVFGFILPVYEIAELCKKKAVPFVLDASQSAGVLDVDFKKLGADFVAMPGHKALFGPQGTGILLCGKPGEVLISGGSGSDSRNQLMPEYLPDRHEAGTHNVPGIAGLSAGIKFVLDKGTESIRHYERELLDRMLGLLQKEERLKLYYGDYATQSGVLSFRVEGTDCEELALRLAEYGVCVRAGLHCSPYAHASAGTLESGTLRVSVSPFTSLENAEEFCRILQNLLRPKL